MNESNLQELLELYMDLAEKQDEVIFRLSGIMKKQAREIQHMRSVYGFFDESKDSEEELLAREAMDQYEAMKTGEI